MPPAAGPGLDAQASPAATPPGPAVDPTPRFLGGPISADGVLWQNGRTTQEMRDKWAAGARGAAMQRCGLCLAPLYLSRGELTCYGCRSNLPIRWRRRVTELWLTGMQASDIAKVVGGTKSAVLSYRRRALLPGRGSPLRGLPDSARAKKPRRRAPTTVKPENRQTSIRVKKPPAAPKLPVASRARRPASPAVRVPGGAVVVVAENASMDRPKGAPPHRARPGFTTCQYIIGKATFCGDPVAELSPYCGEHTWRCFQQRQQRRVA